MIPIDDASPLEIALARTRENISLRSNDTNSAVLSNPRSHSKTVTGYGNSNGYKLICGIGGVLPVTHVA